LKIHFIASYNKNSDVVRELINKKANLDSTDIDGKTSLIYGNIFNVIKKLI
jgi:ankyrin repeat protein